MIFLNIFYSFEIRMDFYSKKSLNTAFKYMVECKSLPILIFIDWFPILVFWIKLWNFVPKTYPKFPTFNPIKKKFKCEKILKKLQ